MAEQLARDVLSSRQNVGLHLRQLAKDVLAQLTAAHSVLRPQKEDEENDQVAPVIHSDGFTNEPPERGERHGADPTVLCRRPVRWRERSADDAARFNRSKP